MSIEVGSMDEWHELNEVAETEHDRLLLVDLRANGFEGSDKDVLAEWKEYVFSLDD